MELEFKYHLHNISSMIIAVGSSNPSPSKYEEKGIFDGPEVNKGNQAARSMLHERERKDSSLLQKVSRVNNKEILSYPSVVLALPVNRV